MALLLGAASSASRAELGSLGYGRGSSPQNQLTPKTLGFLSPEFPLGFLSNPTSFSSFLLPIPRAQHRVDI